ncbi:MAG: thioredoxin domain-containing protein [Ignavibacteriae bacterium]|nr:thioredoxin domain-containing protein [Ignavibacteriota bacterium]MCB9243119.1 thioredoxin domain-containing protein [Ignavibacteriales bacterium]
MTQKQRAKDKSTIIIILLVVLLPIILFFANSDSISLFDNKKPNRLVNEKSPYLLQHAYNPVDWYPWGEEALNKAKEENKPIFLSVGYSTCYWCHVMEKEVFENDSIANLMNEYFINIKVDREERPDIDRIYMTALTAMGAEGGWPMSMFLTPDLKPFYGATYIPPFSSDKGMGFTELIDQIHTSWVNNPKQITSAGNKFAELLKESSKHEMEKSPLKKEIFDLAFSNFVESYDNENGGFGESAKFPLPYSYEFLLMYGDRFENSEADNIVLSTLRKMINGGIYDHLGGGIHRYSVDKYWRVPHFEKMLYDQAGVSSLLINAYLSTGDSIYRKPAEKTLDYVLEKLTSEEGGFYSAEDAIGASVEGTIGEGAYYLWTKKEIDDILGSNADLVEFYFGVSQQGNVPPASDPLGEMKGKNVLYIANSLNQTAQKFKKSEQETEKIIDDAITKLYSARNKRPRLYRDDKIILAWNGLMISSFSKGYSAFGSPKYLDAAKKSADFILANLYDENTHTLKRRYMDKETKYEGNLADYSSFIQGLLDLYEASFDQKYLKTANDLALSMISIFYDNEHGGFYDISGNDKSLLVRTKDEFDGAEPSGNSIAILDILRLAQYTDNKDFTEKGKKSLDYFSGFMSQNPNSMANMLRALSFYLYKPKQIIITGDPSSQETQSLINTVNKRFIPDKIFIVASKVDDNSLIPYLSSIVTDKTKPMAYVCENYTCKLPVNNSVQLEKLLDE